MSLNPVFRRVLCLVPALVAGLLTGCGTTGTAALHVQDAGLHGSLHGGQQPISSSTVQLYAVDITGTGAPTTPLLTKTVLTDANGGFDITGDYTCPSSASPVYLLATGGSPAPAMSNSNITLMTLLGSCGSLSSATFISVNELTTVAAVTALSPYMLSPFNVVASTPLAAYMLQNTALPLNAMLVNIATGATPGSLAVPAGTTVPTTQSILSRISLRPASTPPAVPTAITPPAESCSTSPRLPTAATLPIPSRLCCSSCRTPR